MHPLGNSRKYPCHPTDGFSKFQGQGEFFELKSEGMGQYLRLEFQRQGAVYRQTSLFLKNAYFIDWSSWQMNWQHWQHRVQYKHWSIKQSLFLCSFVEENHWSSARGNNAFWKFRRPGEGIKYGSRAWFGVDISRNCPLQYSCTYFIKMYQTKAVRLILATQRQV